MSMSGRFVYLALTILVLQLSWSAVAAYCGHETGRAAQHAGHHSLPDDARASLAASDLPAAAADSLHSHCASCAHTILSNEALPAVPAVTEAARFAPRLSSLRFSSSWQAPPERPQWIAAV
jgi:hypothetical protein